MCILAIGVNYCIRCLLTSVDYTYAREHGLEFDIRTGLFRRLPEDEVDQSRSRSVNEQRPPSPSSSRHGGRLSPSISLENRSPVPGRSPGSDVPSNASAVMKASPRVTRVHAAPLAGEADPCTSPPIYSFREIGAFAYGRWGVLAVDVNLVASQLGFCIAYMSFISQNMHTVLPDITRVEWIAILFLGWSLMTQIRSMKHIALTSGFGNLVYFVSLSIIFYDGFKYSCCLSASETRWIRPQGLAIVFGTGCFALEGIGLVLPVKRAMADQSRFGAILNVAIAIVLFAYVVFGVLGVLFYGDQVSSVITNNLGGGALSDAVRISLSISLFFTYLIQLFPVSEIVDGVWDSHVFRRSTATQQGKEEEYQSFQQTREGDDEAAMVGAGGTIIASNNGGAVAAAGATHLPASGGVAGGVTGRTTFTREFTLVSSRILLVAFTAGISIAFPNFGLIVSLVGSFSNSAIAFILPMLFYIKLVLNVPERDAQALAASRSGQWWTRNKSFVLPWTVIVLGVCASIIGVTTTIQDMVSGNGD